MKAQSRVFMIRKLIDYKALIINGIPVVYFKQTLN